MKLDTEKSHLDFSHFFFLKTVVDLTLITKQK